MSERLKIETGIQRTPGGDGVSRDVGRWAREAEAFGFDGFVSSDLDYDAFLPLPLVAEHTESINVATRIATAFTRSPMILAYNACDMQEYTNGRFQLGLGTQVQAHNERRFSVEWDSPSRQLREVIEALRHIWQDVFQENDSSALNYEGKYYSLDLMTDLFNPGPIDDPYIPIHIAGINKYNSRLAGELCDGICLHPVSSPSYIEEKINQWVAEGANKANRRPADIETIAAPYVITGKTDEELTREREKARREIAFYGSTPSYHVVFEHHDWDEVGDKLHTLSQEQKFEKAKELVTDEMIDTLAVQAPVDTLGDELRRQYSDIVDCLYLSIDFDGEDYWHDVIETLHE